MTRAFTARELGLSRADVERITGKKQDKPARSPSPRPYHPFRSKWEAEYAKYLSVLLAAGRVAAWAYESHAFAIGVRAKYTADFFVRFTDGRREWHEVKGYRREAGMVRLKVAAKQYPNERFVLVTLRNGQWHFTALTPTRPGGGK